MRDQSRFMTEKNEDQRSLAFQLLQESAYSLVVVFSVVRVRLRIHFDG